ncbi:hypothetical protein ACQP2F_26030 [Actinoplanes sp. CA-030573]|uniref:hypothetical protein n=1 Tax=Actinoplanes sp. CA-030573 TaxID=3239898 RepID=UPI003D949178
MKRACTMLPPCAPRLRVTSLGEATKNPMATVRPESRAVPTVLQRRPSSEAYPVIVEPERERRSQLALDGPASSP